jgi:hypothetical protein
MSSCATYLAQNFNLASQLNHCVGLLFRQAFRLLHRIGSQICQGFEVGFLEI